MASPASVAKHPIHPMLIVFPIALWIFSLISDLIFFQTSNMFWNEMAFYTMAGGIIGALLAAIPGFIDWLSLTDATAKRIGSVHMILNLLLVGLFAINLWLRTFRAPDDYLPVWLSGIGIVILAFSGWLGGELVYVLGVSVEPHLSDKTEKTTPVETPEGREKRVA
ncbi:MAG: DUF2231 domain-containing protein [Acidobacteriota bacterium]